MFLQLTTNVSPLRLRHEGFQRIAKLCPALDKLEIVDGTIAEESLLDILRRSSQLKPLSIHQLSFYSIQDNNDVLYPTTNRYRLFSDEWHVNGCKHTIACWKWVFGRKQYWTDQTNFVSVIPVEAAAGSLYRRDRQRTLLLFRRFDVDVLDVVDHNNDQWQWNEIKIRTIHRYFQRIMVICDKHSTRTPLYSTYP